MVWDDKPSCHNCNWEGPTALYQRSSIVRTCEHKGEVGPKGDEKAGEGRCDECWMEFCLFCAATPAGNRYEYRRGEGDGAILKTICYIGNTLLEKLEKMGEGS